MEPDRFDVVVVGGGPAGISAAVSLARADVSVLVCEAAVYPGAENWSGAVYFTENLEADDCFGREAVEEAPYERRLVERGAFLYDGHSLIGAQLREPDVFRSCYTVLRPVYDRYLAEIAREHGVVLLEETTVQSLIREDGRVVGVHTERGPIYADVVFLAEGDASHLVSQEGYERVTEEQRAEGAPHFLQGVKEVVSLPPDVLEERFGLGPDEGAAYEMLLRNGTRKGRTVRLNMGGFFYVNRDSVSLGFVLPVDNLARHFDGDHNLLMEWFKGLPEIARWIDGGEVTSFGTKIIRGGGYREIPRLVDDGLAIGGAASGIGLDFPYPNFTGPATAMGLLFARAVREIRRKAGGPVAPSSAGEAPSGGVAVSGSGRSPFTAEALEEAYLQPMRRSRYWSDVAYMEDWPDYVERTRVFFERQLDLVNGSATILSRPDMSAPRRWWEWVRLLRRAVPARRLGGLLSDVRSLSRTLGVGSLVRSTLSPAMVGRWLLNTLTALIPVGGGRTGGDDDTGIAEATSRSGGRLRALFRVDAGRRPAGRAPWLVRWWWRRFGRGIADAFADLYTNDATPLEERLRRVARDVARNASVWDLVVLPAVALAAGATAAVQALVEAFRYWILRHDPAELQDRPGYAVLQQGRRRMRLDDEAVEVATGYEAKLGTITYREGEHSHIKVLWPQQPTRRGELGGSSLWHVCPARVYEVRPRPRGLPGVVVNFDNCIKCETCWRATDDVHWSRATEQRLIYETYTPTHGELRRRLLRRPEPEPRLPEGDGYWKEVWAPLEGSLEDLEPTSPVRVALDDVAAGLEATDAALKGFADALGRSPRSLETGRRRLLESRIAASHDTFVRTRGRWGSPEMEPVRMAAGQRVADVWRDAAERFRRLREHGEAGKLFWADVLGEQLRDHHLAGLSRGVARIRSVVGGGDEAAVGVADHGYGAEEAETDAASDPQGATATSPGAGELAGRWGWARGWRQVEARPGIGADWRRRVAAARDRLFDNRAIRALEEGEGLDEEQMGWLRGQLRDAAERGRTGGRPGTDPSPTPSRRPTCRGSTPGVPPYGFRDVLLEELAASDPALAWLAAGHLLAADLLGGAEGKGDAVGRVDSIRRADELAAAAEIPDLTVGREGDVHHLDGTASFVPLTGVEWIVVVGGRTGYLVSRDDARLEARPVGSIGLLGAGIHRLRLDGCQVPAGRTFELPTSPLEVGLADFLAIVRGAGDLLLRRARDHAGSRVQFPGAFQDEAGRETIAKFGAVKQMLAEMEAQRVLVEALSMFDPGPEGDRSVGAAVAKILAAEAFGPGEGSFSYNAGQIFGGTAYSEDDVLAKYYRDSSPFRFLLGHDDELRTAIGRRRLGAVNEGGSLVPVTDVEGVWLERAAGDRELGPSVERWRAGREVVEGWARDVGSAAGDDPGPDEAACHRAGDAVVRALGAKACLLRAVWRRDAGLPVEATSEAARIWADRWGAEAPRLVAEADLDDDAVALGAEAAGEGDLEPAPRIADAGSYRDLLDDELDHRTGGWLAGAFDPRAPRYVRELLWNDEELRTLRTGLEEELRRRYVEKEFDGLPYNRYLERIHTVPAGDRDYLVERGFLRMPIPAELGGEETLKAEYYVLCQMIHRYGDPSLSLLIMGNTSIGTTPFLLGLQQDLPRARAELERIRDRPELLREIHDALDDLLERTRRPDPDELRRRTEKLADLVKERIGRSDVLKYLGGGFLRSFRAAGKAGQRRDLEAFADGLREARDRLDEIVDGAAERLVEYPRRERAHELFLKLISAGYISAFSLTEPTAGSDSGGVKTQGKLKRRRVFEDDDGVLFFYVDEDAEARALEAFGSVGDGADGDDVAPGPIPRDRIPDDDSLRVLVDADRLEFDFEDHRILYRHDEGREPAEIRHDDYDYEGDRPGRWRTYRHGDREVAFTDIAQVRTDDAGRRWYEFWELNGAKMWITNGRFMHVTALYARTEPEGVTGFMVDRHAEGLVVGADEEKLGQRGSPTNELSLNAVRVPRECVIGFRGRGQVNALETLNVGRTGLAVTTGAANQEMLEDAVPYLAGDDGTDGPSVPLRLQHLWLGRLFEEMVATGTVADELVGLLDHPDTDSVRMESAIGKYYGSEAQHRCIDWMERLRGLEGQTHRHRIEKTRRDARVLNIYEGTNEVQRFLLLRDLVQRVLPAWKEGLASGSGPDGADDSPADDGHGEGVVHAQRLSGLEGLKRMLLEHVDEAVGRFGQQLWANVNLQPCTFRLAEIAGLIKVMDAVLYRLEWVERHAADEPWAARLRSAATLFLRRAECRIRALERRYATAYEELRSDRYPAEVELGFLSLEEDGAEAESWGRLPVHLERQATKAPPLNADVEIAVLLKPVPVAAPSPRLDDGALAEHLYAIDPGGRAALRAGLALKARDPGRVRVTAYSVAGPPGTEVLRRALATGVDEAVRISLPSAANEGDSEGDETGDGAARDDADPVAHDPGAVADAVAAALRERPADLVLCGDRAADTGQGATAAWLAGKLDRDHVGDIEEIAWAAEREEGTVAVDDGPAIRVRAGAWGGERLELQLPCVVATAAADDRGQLAFSARAYLDALRRPIREFRVPDPTRPALPVAHRPRTVAADGGPGEVARTPGEAVDVLLRAAEEAGAGGGATAYPYEGPVLAMRQQQMPDRGTFLYVAEPSGAELAGSSLEALETAERLAALVEAPFDVALPVTGDDGAGLVESLAGQILAGSRPRRLYLLRGDRLGEFSWKGRLSLIEAFLEEYQGRPDWLVAPDALRSELARLSARRASQGPSWSWFDVEAVSNGGPELRVASGVFDGAARAEVALPREGGLRMLTLAKSVELQVEGSIRMPGALEGTEPKVYRWEPELDYDPDADPLARLQARLEGDGESLEDADYIVDFGYGAGRREGLEELAEPLRELLSEELGLDGVMIGATRKVTQDLELLPMDRQIGQTGVRVAPKLLIALGVSGAPQHIDWIDEKATILCFNIDPDAPLMRLNEERPRPVVHPVAGDVWETVPAFIEAVRQRVGEGA